MHHHQLNVYSQRNYANETLLFSRDIYYLVIFIFYPTFFGIGHYYRNANLSRLGNPCCPGFPTGNARPRQKGGSFCPGSGNRDKRVRQRTWLAYPFVPTPTGTKGPFFSCFSFLNFFLFQLYFCISIKLMYWNSVCVISTNIYIYIYSYLYNICPR